MCELQQAKQELQILREKLAAQESKVACLELWSKEKLVTSRGWCAYNERGQPQLGTVREARKHTEAFCSRFSKGWAYYEQYAKRWCSIGACRKVSNASTTWQLVISALSKAAEGPIHNFNDTHTHKEVVELWRKTGEREGWL